uniref:Uncharacterized protein n=1 Tax=Trachydiscus minutus TaxID=1032745 RepID=A0A0D3M5K8_9STRA|nr:hypothetical protein [Trachydiscus minutus]AIB04134.1 hypothetical protein Ycf60 [Trachydiscus minutus]
MPKYPKRTLQRLNKLEGLIEFYDEDYEYGAAYKLKEEIAKRNRKELKIRIHNSLIELIFLKIQIQNLTKRETSYSRKILLKSKSLFLENSLYKRRYLFEKVFFVTKKAKSLKKTIYKNIKELKLQLRKSSDYIECRIEDLYSIIEKEFSYLYNIIKKPFFIIDEKTEICVAFIVNQVIKRWYVYILRFLIMTAFNFIPLIQLSTSLFYSVQSKSFTHPIISNLFYFAPSFITTLKLNKTAINGSTFSFLILIPYMHIFAFSSRKYKISRKIAYQGTFAVALILLKMAIDLSHEATGIFFRFAKRFFFLGKLQKIELLRDDLHFYLDDLDEDREELLYLGYNIFSNIPKVAKLIEPTIIFSFLGVIALLYNYMYFIVRGQKAIIPFVTVIVQRMMVDRNGRESS